MILGIESDTGHVYEGVSLPQFAVWPAPSVSQVKAVDDEQEWCNAPRGLRADPFAWVFREDRFDPATRIRKGRLFEAAGNAQPTPVLTAGHPLTENAAVSIVGSGRTRHLHTYRPCTSLLDSQDGGLGVFLMIGQGRANTAWRVIQVELDVFDDVTVTLKAQSAFGILPDIQWESVESSGRAHLKTAYDRVLDSAFRDTPESVIDHCRNFAAVCLSLWLLSKGAEPSILSKDLGFLAKTAEAEPYLLVGAAQIAKAIGRLHVRGKSNEQVSKALRLPTPEDAEFCVHALGFLLREIGLAKS